MTADGAFLQVWTTALAGLGLSVAMERFLRPRPRLARPVAAWLQHVGVWCLAYATFVLLLGRPWCALAAVSAILITLVVVSNAKQKSLREPFIAQDYDYFTDTLRFPRLFLPFLGLRSFCLAALFFVLALLGFWAEDPPASRLSLHGQLGGALAMLLAAAVLLRRWCGPAAPTAFDPERDLQALGLLPSLWTYALASRVPPRARSPFASKAVAAPRPLPHLVAVQSESFFDARELFAGVRPDVLQAFDAMRAGADSCGPLHVPAWGANTIRTEFSFLTGIPAREMQIHRFNPYRAVERGWAVDALPLFLKGLGYRTVCIHPYWGSFYGRKTVLPRLGFDAFLDIDAFRGARRTGPYVGDREVAGKIIETLSASHEPVFVFAITMENHGPLNLDHIPATEAGKWYSAPNGRTYSDLDKYLYHLRNADGMLAMLHRALDASPAPVSLCFYGDHVPIMPDVYRDFQAPDDVPYLLWRNSGAHAAARPASSSAAEPGHARPLSVHDLAIAWLMHNGIRMQERMPTMPVPSER